MTGSEMQFEVYLFHLKSQCNAKNAHFIVQKLLWYTWILTLGCLYMSNATDYTEIEHYISHYDKNMVNDGQIFLKML